MKLCQLHTLAEMAGQKCNKPDAQREVKKISGKDGRKRGRPYSDISRSSTRDP